MGREDCGIQAILSRDIMKSAKTALQKSKTKSPETKGATKATAGETADSPMLAVEGNDDEIAGQPGMAQRAGKAAQ